MKYLQRFAANQVGRDFVIGDLHGQLDQLHLAMTENGFDPAVDRLFSVGDLIDRGRDSKACFELLRESWFHAVQGNHEEMMFLWLAEPDHLNKALWMQNGGVNWAENPDQLFADNLTFRQLVEHQSTHIPYAIDVQLRDGRRVGIVHACCPVEDWATIKTTLEDERIQEKALWEVQAHRFFHPSACKNVDMTVHGHTMVRAPMRRGNAVYIDTGACLRGYRIKDGYINNPRLTMVRLEALFDLKDEDAQ